MKKQIVLIAILCYAAFAQAQEVFITADFVSSYIWRGMDSGNASVQPSLGLNWKGLTVYAWGSTEFREKNNEIDLSLEYEYKNLTLYANNYFTQTEEEPFSGMCAEQGKPQHYQYRIHSDQRFLGTADGGNRCTCLVPYFRSMRKRLCVKLEKLLDAV